MTKQARNNLTVQYMLRGLEEMLQSKNLQNVGVQASAPPRNRRAQAAPCQARKGKAQ